MTNERLKEIKDSIDLQKEYTIYKGFDMDLLQEEIDLYEEVMRLRKEIEKLSKIILIMENYLELIYDLGFDYDDCKTTGDLMNLIDELLKYASLGRACNTTRVIYENNGKKYNILHEELKEKYK